MQPTAHPTRPQPSSPPSRFRRSSSITQIPTALCALCVLCGSLTLAHADDDDLGALLNAAKPAATAPVEPDAPQSQPAPGLSDALGTMAPHAPANARIGVVTLNNGAKIEGRIWTPLHVPFRVWIEETKSYRDIDFSLIKKIDVHVLSQTMEADWRWLKEGSDQKIFSGKKYPNLDLAYKFTLQNGQSLEGTTVAEIDTFDGKKNATLALYKKYHGKLGETLKDLTYITTITLQPSTAATTLNEKKTSKLPLIY